MLQPPVAHLLSVLSKCDKYRRGLIDGSACSSLCEKGTLYLGKCFTAKPKSQVRSRLHTHSPLQSASNPTAPQNWVCTFQVYTGGWGDLEGVIKCQMEEAHRYALENQVEPRKKAAGFNKPSKGTSVEKFREMILDHLKVEVLSETKWSKCYFL